MKCSGDTGLGIDSFQDIHVGVDQEEVHEDDESYDTVDEEELLEQFLLNGNSLDGKGDATVQIRLPSQTIVTGSFRKADLIIFLKFLAAKTALEVPLTLVTQTMFTL